ncbi:FkbM family methyltransferase [Pseudomonadota bacterium]
MGVVILKAVLRKFENAITAPVKRMKSLKKLNRNDYKAKFIHEGDIEIYLPKISVFSALFSWDKKPIRAADYLSRPNIEVLLRKTIFSLYKQGYLSEKKSIIDIGCWLADNSLVWAKLLECDSTVYAVDPSIENLSFGKELAELNGIHNVSWVEAVCSDKLGVSLDFDGQLDHTGFYESSDSNSMQIKSTTLDEIVGESNRQNIGLLHVDVEGFELKVLRGAEAIIDESRPVIIFEQHISKEDVGSVVGFLKAKNYDIFMINEVVPGSSLDCRNFIAFDANKGHPLIEQSDQKKGSKEGIFYACVGADLIEV